MEEREAGVGMEAEERLGTDEVEEDCRWRQ